MSARTLIDQRHAEVARLQAERDAAQARAYAADKRLSEWMAPYDQASADLCRMFCDALDKPGLSAAQIDHEIRNLRSELSRYQRADVGERVRAIKEALSADQTIGSLREGQHDLLAICRQQAAELEDLRSVKSILEEEADSRHRANMRRLEKVRTITGLKLHEQWDQALVRFMSQQRDQERGRHREAARLRKQIERQAAEIERLTGALHGARGELAEVVMYAPMHEGSVAEGVAKALSDRLIENHGLKQEIERLTARLREYETPTDKVPLIEPLGGAESLPAKPDEFRPGLPPLALRVAWKEWEVYGDGRLSFYTNERGRECFKEVGPSGADWIATVADADFSGIRLRPHGKTWAEVERDAARMLGERDAREGRMRCWDDLASAIFEKGPIADWPDIHSAWEQYAAAYDAAKGG